MLRRDVGRTAPARWAQTRNRNLEAAEQNNTLAASNAPQADITPPTNPRQKHIAPSGEPLVRVRARATNIAASQAARTQTCYPRHAATAARDAPAPSAASSGVASTAVAASAPAAAFKS
eukprot:TRINITY_DN2177_c0_g3_i1.p3 TRINITY_DN2177_c0_g3~~TRINITY_DN2177_c0_g3_i1.p3  ORF type:complete len:119 (-),score=2.05 TRINITY_DN2177_c0_g3_i1:496-852(-)